MAADANDCEATTVANGNAEETDQLEELKQRKWFTGKDAVADIKAYELSRGKSATVSKKRGSTFKRTQCSSGEKCTWFINLSVTKRKNKDNFWHVTNGNLTHINCTGTAQPSVQQPAQTSVLRSAIIPDSTISASGMAGQLQADSKLVCSRSMLYRVKEAVLREVFAEDEKSFEYLPRYLSAFCDRNQGTITNLERDHSGNFSRVLVALDPAWFSGGQAIFGVDAAHMKHRLYNGVQIVLVARDGNFQNRVAAVALAPLEDHANYLWFFQILGVEFADEVLYTTFDRKHATR
ncbi:hypothetical protein PC116_g17774 [Phytophthora cactorum]|uniref:Transposase MuDR plant domain-containing protein n=1 Tax=Phytophthora cactorum TaxID=29920 RepID=A0A8T0YK58_9STRA|nr:hypothetical protein PC112_g13908 [Phytophthora cactorum]KAG2816740.1 hypothetical protein PC111_g13010 [Phytophthora cactorum]KAG2853097.1 hypothetical protein PC113_g14445 [Phytophthora cactorum]KAG2895188.1 hypothetical protein PC114_g15574 [Phytophthora cactorum]KAG2908384.1 hypothetical protein PC115_g13588 [Phytophthora cactorum]